MDPVTTSVIAALQKLSEPAIRDAYQGVKALILRKFGGQSRVAAALEEAEAKPSPGRTAVLEEEVLSSAADRDDEILAAVAALTAVVNSSAAAGTVVHQTVSGQGHTFSGSGDVHVTRES